MTEQNILSEKRLPSWTGKSAAKSKKMNHVNLPYSHCKLQFGNPLDIGYQYAHHEITFHSSTVYYNIGWCIVAKLECFFLILYVSQPM